ncbi:hypothetical protein BU16DRAFT_586938 [Lophium mytilinum]|uniref:Uncharacterized protein n=1 Tax=Lophium mytilinum TaxID=390894 RepID=A0A6A6Q7P9_9PEZI|nr:hypothetical protein BU16DRAFT_586938 [Lophium mytilinum]
MSSNNNSSTNRKGKKGRRGTNREGRQGQSSQQQHGQQGLSGGHIVQPTGAPTGSLNPNASAFLPASLPRNPYLHPNDPPIVPASLVSQVRRTPSVANTPSDSDSSPYVPGQGLRYRTAKQLQQARTPAASSSQRPTRQGPQQGTPLPRNWENQDQNQIQRQAQPPTRPQRGQQTHGPTQSPQEPQIPVTDPRYVHAWAPSTTSGGSQVGGSVAAGNATPSNNPPLQMPASLANLFKPPPSGTSTPTNTTLSLRRFLEEPGRLVYEQQMPALRQLIMRFITYAEHDPTGPPRAERVAMLRVYTRGLSDAAVAQRLVYAVRGWTDEVEDALLVEVIREEREKLGREGREMEEAENEKRLREEGEAGE